MPFVDCEATFSVEEDGERSRVTWTAEFKETESDSDAEKMVRGLIKAGLKALSQYSDDETIPS